MLNDVTQFGNMPAPMNPTPMPTPMNVASVSPMPAPMNPTPMPTPMNVASVSPMPTPMNVAPVSPMPAPMNVAPVSPNPMPLTELQEKIRVDVPNTTPVPVTSHVPQDMPVARVDQAPPSPEECPFEIESNEDLSSPFRFAANQFETLKTALSFMTSLASDFRFINGVSCFSTNANRFHVKVKLPFGFDFAIGEANTHIKMLSLLDGDVEFRVGGNLYFFRSSTMLVSLGGLLGSPLGEIDQSVFDNTVMTQRGGGRVLLKRSDVTNLYTTATRVFKSVGGDAVIVRRKGNNLEFSVGYAQNMVRFAVLPMAETFDDIEIDSGFPSELVSMGFDQVYATYYMTANNEIFWHWECRLKDIEVELYTKTFRVPSSSL